MRVLTKTTISPDAIDEVDPEVNPIEGCKRYDPDAQRRLFNDHKDRVYSLAMYMCRDRADAAEITQEVFVKVYSSIANFRGESKFETWLFRIVANTCHDYARKSRRILQLESDFWLSRTGRRPSAEETQVRSQIDQVVRSAVATLPEKFRLPIILRYFDELSYEEISEVLGCPAGTIAARLNRAHKMLAKKLVRLRR